MAVIVKAPFAYNDIRAGFFRLLQKLPIPVDGYIVVAVHERKIFSVGNRCPRQTGLKQSPICLVFHLDDALILFRIFGNDLPRSVCRSIIYQYDFQIFICLG